VSRRPVETLHIRESTPTVSGPNCFCYLTYSLQGAAKAVDANYQSGDQAVVRNSLLSHWSLISSPLAI